MQNKKCIGCGSILQTTDENKEGYCGKAIKEHTVYCKRCFRLKHYNEFPKLTADQNLYDEMLNEIVKKDALFLFVIDLFDFEGSFTKDILDKLRNKDVIIVANKYDLLPKSTNTSSIVEWISKRAQQYFFKVLAIHLVSSKKLYFLDETMQTIDYCRNDRDIYVVGCANVGKSSFINALLKRFRSYNEDLIVTSQVPGTTLQTIDIPFYENNSKIIDTPGLINKESASNFLLPNSYYKILPKVELKPKTFTLDSEQTIFIAGLCFIDILSEIKNNVTCYFSPMLLVHRTKSSRSEELLANHLGEMLNPPTLDEAQDIKYDVFEYENKSNNKIDIVLSGLGFFTLHTKSKIKLHYISGIKVSVRNAIIGNKY